MAGRESVALWLLLPPLDHLRPVCAHDAGVVLQQHPAQDLHRGGLPQPGRGPLVVNGLQQREPVTAVGDGQFLPLLLRQRGPPAGDRGAVAAGPAGVQHARGPARVRRGQRLQRRPHALPGQLQPVQRRDRRAHVRGVGPLLPARLHQTVRLQALQQRVQRGPLKPGARDLRAELRQHRVVEPRVIELQAQQVLPVQRPAHLLSGHPVGQIPRLLQHRHQRQPRRGPPRAAPHPERDREVIIVQPLAQLVTDRHRQRWHGLPGPAVHRPDSRGDHGVRLRPRGRLHRHDTPILQPERGGRQRPRQDHDHHHAPDRAHRPACHQ